MRRAAVGIRPQRIWGNLNRGLVRPGDRNEVVVVCARRSRSLPADHARGELQKMKRKKRACGTTSDYAHGAPILQLIRW